VWKPKDKKWSPRQQGNTIGRILFCLLLLYTVPAPTSWAHLKTLDDILHPTFQAACAVRGLLATDDEWHQCLEEAGFINTGHQLRQLFAGILLSNAPLDPLDLLQRHMHNLSNDCQYRLRTRFHIAKSKSKAFVFTN